MFIKIQNTVRGLWKVWFIVFSILLIFTINSIYKNNVFNHTEKREYTLIWPGILPDNRLYKLKVLRDKMIAKIIIDPVDKVSWDLLMADKTIYASKILLDKGEVNLSKETALKGENYYSLLVQDYNKSLLQNKKIPSSLDRKITLAVQKHQEIFQQEIKKVSGEDKKAFQAAENFSEINYRFIEGLRKAKKG
jgi:hypothetical protein